MLLLVKMLNAGRSTLLMREITVRLSQCRLLAYVITTHQRYRRTDRRHTIAIPRYTCHVGYV